MSKNANATMGHSGLANANKRVIGTFLAEVGEGSVVVALVSVSDTTSSFSFSSSSSARAVTDVGSECEGCGNDMTTVVAPLLLLLLLLEEELAVVANEIVVVPARCLSRGQGTGFCRCLVTDAGPVKFCTSRGEDLVALLAASFRCTEGGDSVGLGGGGWARLLAFLFCEFEIEIG